MSQPQHQHPHVRTSLTPPKTEARAKPLRLVIAAHLVITWVLAGQSLAASSGLAARGARQRDQRGSVTMEQVLWAVAVIAIVAIVVAAIRTFVISESGKIA